MHDILTIGAATRDIFLVSDQFFTLQTSESQTGVAECVALGSKIEIKKFVATTGGGATNAAATFRSLGYKTAIISKIGDDETGRDVIEDLKQVRVEIKYIRKIPNGQTAYSTLLTMPEGERTVLIFRGVSATFNKSDINWKVIKKSKWVYLTSLGGNFTLSKKVIEFAHKHKVRVAWNPGASELKKGWKAFTSIISCVDVFLINKEEAELLTGETTTKTMFETLRVSDPSHTPPLSRGEVYHSPIRIITDGKNGTWISNKQETFHVSTSGTKGISKTGAGDAFGSGFVAAYIKSNEPVFAARVGTINAESVIQHLGAKKGILKEWPSENKLKKIKIK